ncbi:hypothetical protein HHUSO_G34230 [Huso huso]|uniref:PARP catalytic domain-containing protein n=1 Tax=Huso huso TaxID=61971 RepID=A0ABR0Y612_HUSHU
MSITFSGWEAQTDRTHLSSGSKPERGGRYTMYHGTHISIAKNIIKGGFQRSKGGLLGAGVYVSRNIDKAKCYPLNVEKKQRVVLKLKVQVGKVKKIDCDNHPLQKTWSQNGYDTAWVPTHSKIASIKSGREEDCVWDPKRIAVVGIAYCLNDVAKRELIQLIDRQATGAGSDAQAPHKPNCTVCGKENVTPHPLQACWKCSETICPFQDSHKCRN